MELNTSQPQHSLIVAKSARRPLLLILSGIVLIALVAMGLLIWQKNQEIDQIFSQLVESEQRFTQQFATSKDESTGTDLKDETIVGGMAMDVVEASAMTVPEDGVTYEAKIAYIDDNFAKVVVEYTQLDQATQKYTSLGRGEVVYLKKVNRNDTDNWAVIGINTTTSEESSVLKTKYGVTDEIINAQVVSENSLQ